MTPAKQRNRLDAGRLAFAAGALSLLVMAAPPATPLDSASGSAAGWTLPAGEAPEFAVTPPRRASVNVDRVAVVCLQTPSRAGLEIELHVLPPGPLLPRGASAEALKRVPRVEIAVDGQVFGAQLLFSDEYAVVIDQSAGRAPMLSQPLLDALERGRTMVMRFDLLDEQAGRPPSTAS